MNHNYQPIINETHQNFIPAANGNYAVEINQDGCIDTSSCIYYGPLSNDNFVSGNISISQNPTNNFIVIKNNSTINNLSIKLFDIGGKFLKQSYLNGNKKQVIQIDLPKGIYIISLFSNEKLIKSEKNIKT